MNTHPRQQAPLRPDPDARRDAAVASLVRAALATAHGARDKSISPDRYVREHWGNDRTAELILRAPVSPATIASSPALAQVVSAFLEILAPLSAGAALFDRGIKLNFNGAAQINVPGIVPPNVDFVAEGGPAPAVQATTSTATSLVPHKMMSIVILTNEMMHSANAEELVRQALVEAVGPGLDAKLFDANPATATRPAGLRWNIAGLTTAAAGEKAQVIVDDLQALALAIAPVAGNSNVVLIASPDAAVALRLRLFTEEWPVLTSSSLAARTVIMVAVNAVVSAVEGAPIIDASSVSEIHRETLPLEIVSTPGVVATPVSSIYQTDETGLRLRWPLSWALRDTRGVAWMTSVNW